ncbi:MAG: OmpA family protein [Magnetococcales bacterium]|nr:OmpA family protein [Magnetococcales bacterium]
MAKKCPACKKGTPLWFISWADMATLLLCFFVIIVAYSTVQKTRFEELAGSLKDAFGVQRLQMINPILSGQNLIGTEFQQAVHFVELREKIRLMASALVDNGQAQVEEKQDGFHLTIKEGAILSADATTFNAEVGAILDQIGNVLTKGFNAIEIRGYTDSQRAQADRLETTSWYQGARMAAAVATRLTSGGELQPERVRVTTYGEYQPIASNNTPEGRKANRRVEIVVLKEMANTPQVSDASGNVNTDQHNQEHEKP